MYHKGATDWSCLSIDFLNNYKSINDISYNTELSKGIRPEYPLNLF